MNDRRGDFDIWGSFRVQYRSSGPEMLMRSVRLRPLSKTRDKAILPDRDRIHVRRPLSVLEEDGSMIGVLPRRDVVCDQMRVLLSLGFTLRRVALSRHPPSVEVDRAAGQVMQGAAVGAEREAEIAVAELVYIPLRFEGSDERRSSTSTPLRRGSKPNR